MHEGVNDGCRRLYVGLFLSYVWQQLEGLCAFAANKVGSINERKVLVRTNGSNFRIGVRISLTDTVCTNLGCKLRSTS